MVFCCKITIGKCTFTSFNEVEILRTWKKFTRTATIKLPKALHYRENGELKRVKNIRDFIKTNDPVKIELGYNTQLRTEFEGYVSRTKETIPYEIECQDEMYQLKKQAAGFSMPDATVREIVSGVAPGYKLECVDEKYGDFSKEQTTPVKIFEELKNTAGLYTFFRGYKSEGTLRLVCGLPYSDPQTPQTTPTYTVGHNIINNDLYYVSAEDVKVKIYGTSEQANGDVIRVEAGQDGGDIDRWNQKYLTKNELKEIVDRRLENYANAGGYEGELFSFGFPVAEHGQAVRVVDKIYENRDSRHFVNEVRIRVSNSGGYRRTLVLGRRAD